MTIKESWVAFYTIVMKELRRVFRLWMQTLLPPAITTTLYFIIFGHIIGHRVGAMRGYPYIEFICPGLIMMSMITSSYASVTSSFFGAKYQAYIQEILVSPMPNFLILLGYMTGGVARGFIVGAIVTLVALFFTHIHIHSLLTILTIAFLSSCVFSLAGLINAIYAKKFDDIALVPTFVLTPLTYLGGVFYSVTLLPGIWFYVSYINPIVYIVGAFRAGFLGVTDNSLYISYAAMLLLVIALFSYAIYLLRKGVGLRN